MPAPLMCPTECGRTRDGSYLMCRFCWYKVPQELRAEVWRTWRAYGGAPAARDAREAYRAARDAAIKAAQAGMAADPAAGV